MIIKGQKINDRYAIIRTIGEGGMANVYLAHDTILDRNVALKVLRGDLANDEKFVRRFQREALSASSLCHPNIVEMYDVGEDDGSYYIVMEYIEGKTLKQLIKKRGYLTTKEVVDIMLQLTEGLAHAHDSYIIHRDIKPQNVLILENGLVKITDFGIAMAMNSSQLTQTNSVMGSVHYLPPEQASGRGSTIKSDIYSLGIIMYELLTGKLPFKGENAVEIALKHMKDPMPSIRKQLPDIPQTIENIILKSTAKNPKNRYNDVRELHKDLETALTDDRTSEKRYVYKYLEQDLEETKVLPVIKNNNRTEDTGDIVKPITDEDLKRQNKWLTFFGIVFIGLLALVCFIFIVIPFITEVPNVKIPDVSGKSITKAEASLQKLGFKVATEIKEQTSDTIKENLIIKTSPDIGRNVKKGTKVTLYKSIGSENVEIKDYTGEIYTLIQARLEEVNGINVIIEKKTVDDVTKYSENEIIAQDVKAGTKLHKGDSITLYIPNIDTRYPDMVGESWSLAEAEDFANRYELNLVIEYRETDDYDNGVVLSQSRSKDTVVVKGATFKIVVAIPTSVEIKPQ
jgi:eukaryotic-like serine/threonine-protein kinase